MALGSIPPRHLRRCYPDLPLMLLTPSDFPNFSRSLRFEIETHNLS